VGGRAQQAHVPARHHHFDWAIDWSAVPSRLGHRPSLTPADSRSANTMGDGAGTDPPARASGAGIELSDVRPRATEPSDTSAVPGFAYDDEPEGFAASGMAWDAGSGFPYRGMQEDSSVLGKLVRAVTSVASSGVAGAPGGYTSLVTGTLGVEGPAPDGSLEEKWSALEALVPGLTRGTLLLGHVEHAGLGTAAKTSEPLPNCARATFSTAIDRQGRVTSAWVDSDMPLDAPERIEVQVPGSGGGEAGAPDSTAKLVFLRDAGAQDLAKALDEKSAEGVQQSDIDDMWLAPGRSWNMARESHVSSSFIFEPALPLGSIVTKVCVRVYMPRAQRSVHVRVRANVCDVRVLRLVMSARNPACVLCLCLCPCLPLPVSELVKSTRTLARARSDSGRARAGAGRLLQLGDSGDVSAVHDFVFHLRLLCLFLGSLLFCRVRGAGCRV